MVEFLQENAMTLIGYVVGIVGGSSVLMQWIFNRDTKKIDNTAKEVASLQSVVTALQREIDNQSTRIDRLLNEITERETSLSILRKDKHTLEVKHAKNKSCINKAFACEYLTDKNKCPVLIARAENEKAWTEELERKKEDYV